MHSPALPVKPCDIKEPQANQSAGGGWITGLSGQFASYSPTQILRACIRKMGSFPFWGCLLMVGTVTGAAQSPYKVGDLAREEVITPYWLVVENSTVTEQLRQQQALKTPLIFRVRPYSAEEAAIALRTEMARVRQEFVQTLKAQYPNRPPTRRQYGSLKFQALKKDFLQRTTFPLTDELAELWVTGQPDTALQLRLVAQLHQAMADFYICADPLPADLPQGPPQVRLFVPNAGQDRPRELKEVLIARELVRSLNETQNHLQQRLPSALRAYGPWLASFIQPTCAFDNRLTAEARSRAVNAIISTERYHPGQTIVRAGEIITPPIKAALDQLAHNSYWSRLWLTHSHLLLTVGAASLVLLSLSCAILLLRQRARTIPPTALIALAEHNPNPNAGTALPVLYQPNPVSLMSTNSALQSLSSNASTAEALRAGLLPQLVRFMQQRLVRVLIADRAHLLDTQRKAEAELAALEQRLMQIHAPLQERLLAYEKRVADLEQELAARGEENRELINAAILLAKQKIEAEKQTNRIAWN